MKNKILVFGGSGMLGNAVVKYFSKYYKVLAPTSAKFNILNTNVKEIEHIITKDITAVINCAGVVKPRLGLYTEKEVFKINSWFPIQLSKIVKQKCLKFPMIHISTDCVFTGNDGPYKENSIPDSLDLYGMSKIIGEACVKDSMVIRTSIIGEEEKNKYSLLEWVISQKGKEVSGWPKHIWSGVTTLQLAKFIHKLMKDDFVLKNEAIHYVSKPINKYELLKLINKVYKLQLKVKKYTLSFPCDRSLTPISSEYKAPSLENQLHEMRDFFNEYR